MRGLFCRVALGSLAVFIGFSSFADDRFYKVRTHSKELKIMAYNVQNLFDAQHDAGKNDYEFLPKSSKWKKYCDPKIRPKIQPTLQSFDFLNLSFVNLNNWKKYCLETDWTHTKVDQKIERVKIALDLQGDYPDVLALSEVENPEVVSQLARALGYPAFYMTDSPDKRGIDLAVLFMENKLTPIDYVEREVEDSLYPTRNASAVHFRTSSDLGSVVLGIYPVHWPSQRGPTRSRISAAKTVRKLVNSEKRKYRGEDYHAVILGDFNTVESESPHPIESVILDRRWSNQFRATRVLAERENHAHLHKMPKGTYYYGVKDVWNMFDQLLVTGTLDDGRGLEVLPKTYRIHAPGRISKENDMGERIPFRYNHRTDNGRWVGYSDHYAVHVKLKFID